MTEHTHAYTGNLITMLNSFQVEFSLNFVLCPVSVRVDAVLSIKKKNVQKTRCSRASRILFSFQCSSTVIFTVACDLTKKRKRSIYALNTFPFAL